jgi:O-antigen ligase
MRINLNHLVSQSIILTLLAILVTTSLWNTDPLLVWGYEIAVFAVAGWACLQDRGSHLRMRLAAFPLAVIGLLGFVQLILGSTVYRWATFNTALQNLALAATALAAFLVFRTPAARGAFLRNFRWFSLTLCLVSVLSYWTSPGKILWIFPALYPDNWGPFPSRNNFAQFLELSFPLALFEMGHRERSWAAAFPPAAMLGAGLGCASRAGSVLLIAEAVTGLFLMRQRFQLRRARASLLTFALASAACASLAGAGVLVRRFAAPDPFQDRREIFRSTLLMIKTGTMIQARAWMGYGLGSFSTVYPQFAEFDPGASVEHAHNDWLEWTAEGGLVYAAAWAVLAVWSVRPAVRSIWGLGVPAVFLHALVDYPFARLGISVWVFLLLGVLAREPEKSSALEPLFEWRDL